MAAPNTLIQITHLAKCFSLRHALLRKSRHFVHAVDGIDLSIACGERIGLIGATGAGKSITGKLLARLIEPSAGTIVLHEGAHRVDVTQLRGQQLKHYWQHVQMLFPNARESLDPRHIVFDAVAEPLRNLSIRSNDFSRSSQNTTDAQAATADEAYIERVAEMLQRVGLSRDFLFRYPSQLSDAQLQRVTLARAFIARPALIIADDPFAQLDASLRAGLMRTLRHLLQHMRVSLVYLTRDPITARYLCERIGVMLRGKIVELGATESVLQTPAHPYTRAWLSALSCIDLNASGEGSRLNDALTHSIDPHPRCRFYDHCPIPNNICRDTPHPPLEDKGAQHYVACYQPGV